MSRQRRGLALLDNPLDMLVSPTTGAELADHVAPEPPQPSPQTAEQETAAMPVEETSTPIATKEIISSPKTRARKADVRKKSEPHAAGVSASRAYRIGTVLDPYRRADGEIVRPLRLTLPVGLIESVQVLAIRRGRKTTALIQELIEQFVREHDET